MNVLRGHMIDLLLARQRWDDIQGIHISPNDNETVREWTLYVYGNKFINNLNTSVCILNKSVFIVGQKQIISNVSYTSCGHILESNPLI